MGHNSRSCKARKKQLATEADEAACREVENHWEETMDAACEINLTQGYPHSLVDTEVGASQYPKPIYF